MLCFWSTKGGGGILGIQPNKGTYLNSNIISYHKVEIISEDDIHNLIVHTIMNHFSFIFLNL